MNPITHNIDIMLVPETYFTRTSGYYTQHPDGKTHGDSIMFVKRKTNNNYENKKN